MTEREHRETEKLLQPVYQHVQESTQNMAETARTFGDLPQAKEQTIVNLIDLLTSSEERYQAFMARMDAKPDQLKG